MTKEGLIRLAKARHRVEQKFQERHFSDESVLQMKRACEIICERYESKIKELEKLNAKMKCCANCKHEYMVERCYDDECENLSHWELRED